MELRLAGTFLPLLLLTWLPAGLAHQISATIDVSVGFDLFLQCLLQAGTNSTDVEVKWFNVTQNDGEEQNECGVEMKNSSNPLTFRSVNRSHAGTYTCRVENTRNTSENSSSKQSKGAQGETPAKTPQSGTKEGNKGTVSQPAKPDNTVQCKFKIIFENLTVQVKWYEPECLEAPEENSMSFTSSSTCTAHTEVSGCKVFIKRSNSTDTGNSTQTTVPNCGPAGPQTNVAGMIWTAASPQSPGCNGGSQEKSSGDAKGLNLLLCILLGLAAGTLLYLPVIGFLLCQCRRNRTGKLPSREVAEGHHLSTAAPVTGTVDLTYANLNFEKKGTEPATSNVIYTEVKPSQQKQRDGDASAASTGVAVSPEEEGK